MLTLEDTLNEQHDLNQLCTVKPPHTSEIFCGNFFYGIDQILKKYAGLSPDYAVKAVIPHGVGLNDDFVVPEEIENPLAAVLCYPAYRYSAYKRAILEQKSSKKIIQSASPFLYMLGLLEQTSTKPRQGTIFFPAHSTLNIYSETDFESLAEELLHLEIEYHPVTVCIYWTDFLMGRHIPFQKRGLNVVSAGYRDDPNFLFRFYHLCSLHKYASSNVLGSHIFYSVKSGCSYFHLETNTKCQWIAKDEIHMQREFASPSSDRKNLLKRLFSLRQSESSAEQQEVVDSYLGAEFLQAPHELRQTLLEVEELYCQARRPYRAVGSTAYHDQTPRSSALDPLRLSADDSAHARHILLYTDDSRAGGVAQYNHSVLCKLVELGYRVSLVQSRSSNPLIEQQKKLGVSHYWLEFDTVTDFGRTLTNSEDAQTIFAEVQPDFIFFSDACPLSNFAAKQAAVRAQIPYTITIGFVATYLAERFASYIYELSTHYSQAKAVIAVSQDNLNLLHRHFGLQPDKGQVIHYGRPETYFKDQDVATRRSLRQELQIPSDAMVCLTAARLEGVKGFQYQLAAIHALRRTSVWSQLHFIWAGSGSQAENLQQALDDMGVADHVKMVGHQWNIADWLDVSDIFLLPSQAEGMPLAIMEAMAKGLPVMASAVSGIPEEIGNTGKLLPDPNVSEDSAIAELITTLETWTRDNGLRQRLGKAAKTRAISMFREERMLDQTVEVVRRALEPVQQPLVSIVIPCYNHANFLPEAVASVVSQTYENWEIIIVNDGSPDNTEEVSNALIKVYPGKNIQLLNKENGGLASARNAGMAVAKGDYILPLDPDDKLNSTALIQLLQLAMQQKTPCVTFGSYEIFGIENKKILSADLYSPEKIKRLNMLHASSMFSREVWERLGGYKSDFIEQGYEDWDFWLNCHNHQIPFLGTKETIIFYRRHIDSMYLKCRHSHNGLHAQMVCHYPELFDDVTVTLSANLLFSYLDGLEDYQVRQQQFSQILPTLDPLLERYQRGESTDTSAQAELRKIRQELAIFWTSIPTEHMSVAYLSDAGKLHDRLIRGGIRCEILTSEDHKFLSGIGIMTEASERVELGSLLVGMLYFHPADMGLPYRVLEQVPKWLLNDVLSFIFDSPKLFSDLGDVDRHADSVSRWLDDFHTALTNDVSERLSIELTSGFAFSSNCIPLYFSEKNLKEAYSQRADLIYAYLEHTQLHSLEHEFSALPPVEKQKIRLGILASHFQPSTETFHTLPAYKYLNWDAFDVTLFTIQDIHRHRVGAYCAGYANNVVQLPPDLRGQVETIRSADLDILLVATNVTAVTHSIVLLASHRLARIQVTFGSSPVTTGLKHMDYFLSGTLSEPEVGAQEHYRETLITLDGVGYCFDYPPQLERITVRPTRQQWGVKPETVVFISGANFYKLIPELRETWVGILAQVPDSVLVLYPFAPSWARAYPKLAFLEHMYAAMDRHGVDQSRLVVLDAMPSRTDVKECLKLADVYLDSFRHSGGHSLVDALEVGLPSVVLEGDFLRAKHAAAYLKELCIPELITIQQDDYSSVAIALGQSAQMRSQFRQRIQAAMSANPRFLNPRDYSRQVGNAFERMYQDYLATELTPLLNLSPINVIVFPDWQHDEDELLPELAMVIHAIAHNPARENITLLIDSSGIEAEEADLALSSIAMNLMMEDDAEIYESLEISLIDQLNPLQWRALFTRVEGRIVLNTDNQAAIAFTQAKSIPQLTVEHLSNLVFSNYSSHA